MQSGFQVLNETKFKVICDLVNMYTLKLNLYLKCIK